MGNWGISPNATPKEKLKAEMVDYLNGLNSVGEISYETYSKAIDFSLNLLEKMYQQGKQDSPKLIESGQLVLPPIDFD